MTGKAFRAAGYPWRLYCGAGAIEQGLREAVERAGARRAFVICSPSINRRTETVRRIAVAVLAPALGKHIFLLRLQHGEPPDFGEIAGQAALGRNHRKGSSHQILLFGPPGMGRSVSGRPRSRSARS